MESEGWRLQGIYVIDEDQKIVVLYNARHRKVVYT
jgi:mRNA-degrading endonuclease RelE of RelBE toxin-antitoxin system